MILKAETEAIKLAILNCNKEIAKLNEKVIKLKTFAIFMTQQVSAFIGADTAKEFIKFIEEETI